ncbi:MAG TPA: phosphoribosyltransferase family protein [archaeon]|nr:phosphoribosyltransferase family protein [archaeon]
MHWDEFTSEIAKLIKKIGFNANVVVGITRGGVIPARILCSKMKINEMYCINIDKSAQRVITPIEADLSNKRIILIEDVLESATNMTVARKYLEGKGAEVKTAALYYLENSKELPDYFLSEAKKVPSFPWER